MTLPPPSDADVVQCLERGLHRWGDRAGVAGVERAPYAYATSYPLEEVLAHLDDGRTLRLILKDLSWERLLGDARRSKPQFLYDPRRCIQTYEAVLWGTGIGTPCFGTLVDERSGRYLLLLEKVAGVELWQIGELAVWESVARWLARFHRTFADTGEGIAERNPHLLRYGPDLLRTWPSRALHVAAQRGADLRQRRRLEHIASHYDAVVERLTGGPQLFVHGELYPANVLVGGAGPDVAVWPIDWEMAGVGSPLLDVAALTAGWHGPERAKLVDAYLDELRPAHLWDEGEDVEGLLDCARLHYALQWLGWSSGWSPPPEHARDWVSEAVELADRLGL